MKRRKLALIGAGNIGGAIAYLACLRGLGDIILIDIAEGLAQGKALDILQAAPLFGSSIRIIGSNNYPDIAGSDLCIITAGLARKPGMSRDDLLSANQEIITSVAKQVRSNAPESFVIVVSNPLDAMVTVCQHVTDFPPERVVGMAGVLDAARYRAFLAQEIGVSANSINALVLGGHGDEMVPVRSATTVNGIPVSDLLSSACLDEIEKRVRSAGGEIVALLKSGSAFYSPAAAALEMAESFLYDQKKLLPCAAYLSGEYGYNGLYMGVPVVIGANGVEKIIEINLTDQERTALDRSAAGVRGLVAKLA